MKVPLSRKSNGSLKFRLYATFGRIDAPRAGRRSLLGMATLSLLITGAASADWRVYDDDVHLELRDEIKPRIGDTSADGSGSGSVTGNQKLAYEQYKLGTYKISGDPVENPQWPAASTTTDPSGAATTTSGFKLESFSDMSGTAAAVGGGAMTLNSNIARCGGTRAEQKAICQEIVRTENAQFIYNVRFHEMAAERLERLREIEEERQALGDSPQNYGKLQDNTNKLLALNTRMALDNAQMESATQAYSARLAFLKNYQAQKTREQMSGRASGAGGGGLFDIDLGSLGGAVVGGVVLKGALETQQSSEPEGYKRMDWL